MVEVGAAQAASATILILTRQRAEWLASRIANHQARQQRKDRDASREAGCMPSLSWEAMIGLSAAKAATATVLLLTGVSETMSETKLPLIVGCAAGFELLHDPLADQLTRQTILASMRTSTARAVKSFTCPARKIMSKQRSASQRASGGSALKGRGGRRVEESGAVTRRFRSRKSPQRERTQDNEAEHQDCEGSISAGFA